jgi:hypothetical protein
LKVPRATALTIPAALESARGVDPERITSILLGLRDETALVKAMTALAAVRLKASGAAKRSQ